MKYHIPYSGYSTNEPQPEPGDRGGSCILTDRGWWVLDSGIEFTPKVPTEPGAYWWKLLPADEDPELIHVIHYPGCLVAVGKSLPIDEWGGIWSAALFSRQYPIQGSDQVPPRK